MSTARLTLLIYDIADDRRRNRLHKLLKQYGVPVQESAFEGRLTDTERTRLLEKVGALLSQNEDRFVMYLVPPAHEELIRVVGLPRPEIPVKTYFIV